jgi:hypothetical protein
MDARFPDCAGCPESTGAGGMLWRIAEWHPRVAWHPSDENSESEIRRDCREFVASVGIIMIAGEPGDRRLARFVSANLGEREESPDSERPEPDGLRQGNAPGNARGLRSKGAKAFGRRGYGKCHRKQTADDACTSAAGPRKN